jgi:hypothetical protein
MPPFGGTLHRRFYRTFGYKFALIGVAIERFKQLFTGQALKK